MFSLGDTSNTLTAAEITNMSTIHSILDSIVNSPPKSSISTSPVKTVNSAISTAPSDDDDRPKHSYMNLIIMALHKQPQRQGTLQEIYNFITSAFPYYTKNRKHWKNSVRHNLALHKCFKRLDSEADRIKGTGKSKVSPLWALLSVPENSTLGTRERNKSGSKKRRGGESKECEKSSSAKKLKINQDKAEITAPISKPSTVSPLTSISMMLPMIGSGRYWPTHLRNIIHPQPCSTPGYPRIGLR